MENRLRLMQGATALLYFGPLLAGLGGFGWSVVPVFVAIFVLWLFILRPHQWPRSLADWQSPQALVTLAAQVAVQVLLVLVCFGIGRGIGGVLGALPPFPLMLPIAVSFLSIPLCRMIWDPWKMAEMDRFLGDALAQIKGMGEPEDPAQLAADVAKADAMLAALPLDLSPEDTISHLRAMERSVSPVAIRDALLAKADRGDTSHLRALVIFSTDCRLADIVGGDLPTRAFQRLPDDPALIGLFAQMAWSALKTDSDLYWVFPQSSLLQERQVRLAGTEAVAAIDSLLQLYDLIEAENPDQAAD